LAYLKLGICFTKTSFLEIDSLIVVNRLTTNMVCLPLVSTLIDDYRELLRSPWLVISQYIYREAKTCVNFMINKGRSQRKNLVIYVICSSFFVLTFCLG
jgi:hypothetical protein